MESNDITKTVGKDTGTRLSRPWPIIQAEADDPIFREGPSSFTLPPGMTGKYLKKRAGVSVGPGTTEQPGEKEAEPVIDLTELGGWPKGYLDSVSSDLTCEQRKEADRDEDMGCPIGRLKMRFGHRGLPRQWVVDYGWPGVLDKVREYASDNNIKLIEPESYLSGDIRVHTVKGRKE